MEPSPFPIDIDQSHFKLRESSMEYIERRIEKLEAWTRKFPTRSCHISQEHSAREGTHRFTIALQLPNATLVGHAEEKHLRGAFDRAFRKLMRQLNEFKQHLRRENVKQRGGRRRQETSGRTPSSFPYASPEHEREVFDREIDAARDSLAEFLEFEWRQLNRDGQSPELQLPQLVEETITAAKSSWEDKPRRVAPRGWLFETGLRALEHRAGRSVRPAPQAGGALGSKVEAFRELFSDDDHRPSPEFDQLLGAKFAELPRDWRRCFRLHYVDGLDHESIERILELSPEQIEFRLRGASEFLREHLEEIGESGDDG